MKTRPVPSKAGISLSILNPRQIQAIHAASMDILARTGVAVHDAAALALLKTAGAPVEGEPRPHEGPSSWNGRSKTAPKSIRSMIAPASRPCASKAGSLTSAPVRIAPAP